jgi:hypothetical protein
VTVGPEQKKKVKSGAPVFYRVCQGINTIRGRVAALIFVVISERKNPDSRKPELEQKEIRKGEERGESGHFNGFGSMRVLKRDKIHKKMMQKSTIDCSK